MAYFKRPALAKAIVEALSGENPLQDGSNGIFLAAPRRTGKSTFLREDLIPALNAMDLVTVYVDLWSAPDKDPGEIIATAIGRAIQARQGHIAKFASKVGLKTITVGGVLEIDTTGIGQSGGTSLVDALQCLSEAAVRPVALIVDEAQHALTSPKGEAAMIALKSARDQLNAPGRTNLMLVMSGSDRDKLMRLVNSSDSPFLGSVVQPFPELGNDFVEDYVARIERAYPQFAPVDLKAMIHAFELISKRPQLLIGGGTYALDQKVNGRTESFATLVVESAEKLRGANEAEWESAYLGLRPIERAILWRMLEKGEAFRPYDAESLQFYSAKVGEPVSTARVQKAIEGLRAHERSLVWKSARGDYSANESQMKSWYENRKSSGTWPPAEPASGSTPPAPAGPNSEEPFGPR